MAFRSRRRAQDSSRSLSTPIIGALAGAALLVVAVVWLWGRSGEDPEPTAVAPTGDEPAAELEEPPRTEPDPDLPELSRSDEFVRDAIARLSAHPELAAWLVTDGLVHRFVASVAALAGRGSPAPHLDFMAPEGEFLVRESGERYEIDPASYRRYDLAAETFGSLDTSGSAELYERLQPLFEEAYSELGLGEGSFEETLALAVRNVQAVQVPEGPVEVYPADEGVVYIFANDALEGSSPAAKHLVRMGPENARTVQAKVTDLADAVGLESD